MDIWVKLLIVAFISGWIGWITNYLAIWMLFNPKNPVYIFGFKIQGIFPKRQNAIAEKLSDMIVQYLLNPEAIKNQIFNDDNISELKGTIEDKIHHFLEIEFNEHYPIFSLIIGRKNRSKIKDKIMNELHLGIIDLEENWTSFIEKRVDLRKVIYEKISSFDSDEINNLMKSILSKELKFIEWVGAILGFLIGIIQFIIIQLL